MHKALHGVWALALFQGASFVSANTAPAPAVAEENVRFDIWAFRVDGNGVLEEKTLEKAIYPYAGPGKGLEDVEKARQSLEKAFHDAGYTTVLVDIPEQDVNEGLVVLNVLEGQVERLKVTGSRFHSLRKIKDQVPALAEGQVPHMPSVQKQMEALSGQSPDRKVTPVMRAGQTPGKLEVELQVEDKLPLHGSLEMNSRNSANTTYSRLIGSVSYGNLWQRFHSASLQYQVSPQNYDEVEVWSGTYAMPTGLWDSRLAFYGVGIASNTNIATVGAMSVVGSGEIYGVRWVLPLGSGETYYHNFTAGFDYKDFGQSVNLLGGTGKKTAGQTGKPKSQNNDNSTPVAYAPFMLGYTFTQQGENRLSSLDLGLHFSLRGVGNDAKEFARKRSNPLDQRYTAKPDYLYLAGELRHQEILPHDFRLLLRGSGQVTDQPLITNEQFSAGGVTSVRGYHQTEVLGDNGVNGSIEIYTPKLWNAEQVQELRALAFLDAAKVWVIGAYQSPSSYKLAGAGAGLRMKVFNRLVGEFDWSYPFYSTTYVHAGNQRVDFRLAYVF
ncbi:MAG: ShlB/FhaC/HecB family hemolysin secretion/activation protein [Methylococcaceae bacterium]|nr:ShlB/FhaC/HecB family hemolysin secretion/activation protein [Methylococcaceae bacterium]